MMRTFFILSSQNGFKLDFKLVIFFNTFGSLNKINIENTIVPIHNLKEKTKNMSTPLIAKYLPAGPCIPHRNSAIRAYIQALVVVVMIDYGDEDIAATL
jgi:hypothetical protein